MHLFNRFGFVLQECKKMEGILAALQRKHENEVADLQATVDRLLKVDLLLQQTGFEAIVPESM